MEITEDQLKKMVAEEVKKALTTSNSNENVVPKCLFDNLRISRETIQNINKKHGIDINHQYGTYSRNQYFIDNHGELKEYGPDYEKINELVRKLTLSVFGESLIRKLKPCDYFDAREVYSSIKDVFLKSYDERLGKIGHAKNMPTKSINPIWISVNDFEKIHC